MTDVVTKNSADESEEKQQPAVISISIVSQSDFGIFVEFSAK